MPRCSTRGCGCVAPVSLQVFAWFRVLVTDLVVGAMAFDACSWLLFAAVLVNQAGRVMIPAIKTSVLVDPDFAPAFEQNVGAMRPEPSPQP